MILVGDPQAVLRALNEVPEQRPEARLAVRQRAFALAKGFQQRVESADELADFVRSGNGQGAARVGQCRKLRRRRLQWSQLAADDPPGQGARQQGDEQGCEKHAPLQFVDRGERFTGGQAGNDQPARGRDAFA